MKFFDLEMDACFAGGGRSLSYVDGDSEHNIPCSTNRYTHGNNYTTCMENRFKFALFNSQCRTHYEQTGGGIIIIK